MHVDYVLGYVGSWGRYQKYLFVLVFIAGIPNAFITMQFVISHYEPDYRCKLPGELINTTQNAEEYEALLDYVIPKELDNRGEIRQSRCHMYARNYSKFVYEDLVHHVNDSAEIIACIYGITYNTSLRESAVTDFDLGCGNEWKTSVSVSIFQAGKGLGSLCGALADRVGRRTVFLWSCLVQIISTVLIGASWNYYVYLLAVFISGISGFINYIVAYVLATELMAVEWRNFIGTGLYYSYFLGYVMMPAISHLLPNWRWCMYTMAILTAICYSPHYWFLPESARWQLTKGKTEEAIKELRKIGRMNGKKGNFETILKEYFESEENTASIADEQGFLVTLRLIFNSCISARCIAMIYGWFVTCMIYYAIAYYSTSFSDDRNLNILFSCLAEGPAYIMGFYLLKYFGRPRPLVLLMLVCGLSSIILPFISEDYSVVRTVLSMTGKTAIAASYLALYMITTELVPTLHRSSVMFAASCIGRIGSFLSSYIMYLGKIHYALPNCTMGVLALLCAVTSILYIPETRGVKMPDSVAEAQTNRRFYKFNLFKKMPKDVINTNISKEISRKEYKL